MHIAQAEELKKKYGFVWEDKYLDFDKDILEVDLGYQGKKKRIETYELYEILQPRADEVFDFLCDEMVKFRLKSFMPSGLVLTGGGSMLAGIRDLAEKRFNLPVRIGIPTRYKRVDKGAVCTVPDLLKNPIYATGYGLLIYAGGHNNSEFNFSGDGSVFKNIFGRMKSWIYDFI